MRDTYHLPGLELDAGRSVEFFWPTQLTGASTGWQTWRKNPGLRMLEIICISGGAGGASGDSEQGGFAAAQGGGGGGSSGISRYLYPMWMIPERLHILVGQGGPGGASVTGAAGQNGTAGQLSYVSLHPVVAANNLFAISGAAAPTAGQAGGAAGSAGTIATDADAVFSCWGITQYIAGQNGTAGSNGTAAGTDQAIGTAVMILGGTGGGGANSGIAGGGAFAGGSITAVANTPFLASAGGTTSGTRAGNSGFRFGVFPLNYSGTGGGGTALGAGGRGGAGSNISFGCGGAGGGGCPTASASGAGGQGGPGLVLMVSY